MIDAIHIRIVAEALEKKMYIIFPRWVEGNCSETLSVFQGLGTLLQKKAARRHQICCAQSGSRHKEVMFANSNYNSYRQQSLNMRVYRSFHYCYDSSGME